MVLISGPAASGKTSYCLERLRDALRNRESGVVFLVPTTTMAEHLRNELVREGFVFSPSVITTFSKFASEFFGGATAATSASLEIIVDEVLKRGDLPRYVGVREFAGFRRTLVRAIEEFTSAGGDPDQLLRSGADAEFVAVYRAVAAEVKRRGWHFRSALLHKAGESLSTAAIRKVWMAGFFSFTPPELALVMAMARRTELTVALTDWAGARLSFAALRALAPEELRLDDAGPAAFRALVKAPSVDRECSEIARRILDCVASGRQFRDIGIILRSQVPYATALQTALDRFGIPSRLYFGNPLASNATVRYLLSVIDALLSGWDHQTTLSAVRMAGSPLYRNDGFEYKVMKALPGSGLDGLAELAPESRDYFDKLSRMTPWQELSALPNAWASRFNRLRTLVAAPLIGEPASHTTSLLWREQSIALKGFDEAVEETRAALSAEVLLTCSEFVSAVRMVLGSHTLRNIDHRRNVVHIIDAFEARQWKLPVIFVPGLLEKQFPKYQSESPVLPDRVRRELQGMGVPMRTSREREQDERFLFDVALSRANDEVVLSYPELNAKGDENLPSFFLKLAEPYSLESCMECRPEAQRQHASEPFPSLYDEALRTHVASLHTRVAATPIESFLQCPFQFFLSKTLRLKETPMLPEERLTPPVQGNIAHRALELCFGQRMPLEQAFAIAFESVCREAGVHDSYRTEAVRLDLLHNVRLLHDELPPPMGAVSEFEKEFRVTLEGVTITGKIDRIDVDQQGRAAIIDYKYKSKQRLRDMKGEWENGALVQAGLYAMGVPGAHSVHYVGFKREFQKTGWTGEDLVSIVQQAKERTLTAVQQIHDGRIEPMALDEERCRYCAFRSACRKDSYAMHRVAVQGASS